MLNIFSKAIDKRGKYAIMELPKGKNHQFSRGTTQSEGTQCRFPHPRQNNLHRSFPESAQEERRKGKEKRKEFQSGNGGAEGPVGRPYHTQAIGKGC